MFYKPFILKYEQPSLSLTSTSHPATWHPDPGPDSWSRPGSRLLVQTPGPDPGPASWSRPRSRPGSSLLVQTWVQTRVQPPGPDLGPDPGPASWSRPGSSLLVQPPGPDSWSSLLVQTRVQPPGPASWSRPRSRPGSRLLVQPPGPDLGPDPGPGCRRQQHELHPPVIILTAGPHRYGEPRGVFVAALVGTCSSVTGHYGGTWRCLWGSLTRSTYHQNLPLILQNRGGGGSLREL